MALKPLQNYQGKHREQVELSITVAVGTLAGIAILFFILLIIEIL
jgi:hypothetical protein